MSEAPPNAERSPGTHRDPEHAPVEAPVIPKESDADKSEKERLNEKLHGHSKEGHDKHGAGHDEHGHGKGGEKAEKAVGAIFTYGGGTGALMVEPGAGIAAVVGGPTFAAKFALAGLKVIAPFATLLGFPSLLKWIVDKSVELSGTKVPAAGGGGSHGGGDHGGGGGHH